MAGIFRYDILKTVGKGRKGDVIQVREGCYSIPRMMPLGLEDDAILTKKGCYSSPRMMPLGLEDDAIQSRKWRNMQWRTVQSPDLCNAGAVNYRPRGPRRRGAT